MPARAQPVLLLPFLATQFLCGGPRERLPAIPSERVPLRACAPCCGSCCGEMEFCCVVERSQLPHAPPPVQPDWLSRLTAAMPPPVRLPADIPADAQVLAAAARLTANCGKAFPFACTQASLGIWLE